MISLGWIVSQIWEDYGSVGSSVRAGGEREQDREEFPKFKGKDF